jgi:hypothetical protein
MGCGRWRVCRRCCSTNAWSLNCCRNAWRCRWYRTGGGPGKRLAQRQVEDWSSRLQGRSDA